jgi:beta-glucosidase
MSTINLSLPSLRAAVEQIFQTASRVISLSVRQPIVDLISKIFQSTKKSFFKDRKFMDTMHLMKKPFHHSIDWFLGDCIIKNESNTKIQKIAIGLLKMGQLILALPVWAAAEIVETFVAKDRFCEKLSFPSFDEKSTCLKSKEALLLGTSTSTFQTTSDPNFCKPSAMQNFLESKGIQTKLGVDVLTEEGRNLTLEYLKRLHANAFRFSIEWVDVQKNGLDRYKQAIRFFHQNNIRVVITLDHWLGDGGIYTFEKPEKIDEFVDFCAEVYNKTYPYVDAFITFNEPAVDGAQKYILKALPPNQLARFWSHIHLVQNKVRAHKKICNRIHTIQSKADKKVPIGISHQAMYMLPNSRFNYLARVAAYVLNYIFHKSFFKIVHQNNALEKTDFIGVQFYSRPVVGRNGIIPVTSIAPKSPLYPDPFLLKAMQYRFDPFGIFHALQDVFQRTNKPLLITETGVPGQINLEKTSPSTHSLNDSEFRKQQYYEKSMQAVQHAQNSNIPILGVLFWTLFDNLEWQHGYDPECSFGILARDPKSGKVRTTAGFETIRDIFQRSRKSQILS